jgi:hypothetical protein
MPQRPASFEDEIRRTVDELDEVLADMSSGRPSQFRHDGHVDQVVGLAERLIRAARGPGRPVNPPIAKTATGAIW